MSIFAFPFLITVLKIGVQVNILNMVVNIHVRVLLFCSLKSFI